MGNPGEQDWFILPSLSQSATASFILLARVYSHKSAGVHTCHSMIFSIIEPSAILSSPCMRNFNDFRIPILRTSIFCASILAYPLNLRDRKTKIVKMIFAQFYCGTGCLNLVGNDFY